MKKSKQNRPVDIFDTEYRHLLKCMYCDERAVRYAKTGSLTGVDGVTVRAAVCERHAEVVEKGASAPAAAK